MQIEAEDSRKAADRRGRRHRFTQSGRCPPKINARARIGHQCRPPHDHYFDRFRTSQTILRACLRRHSPDQTLEASSIQDSPKNRRPRPHVMLRSRVCRPLQCHPSGPSSVADSGGFGILASRLDLLARPYRQTNPDAIKTAPTRVHQRGYS